MKALLPLMYVGIGGAIGSLMRYGMTLLFPSQAGALPWGTFVSNVVGCLIIGGVAGLAANSTVISLEIRLFVATGICGGFTTLSSLMFELAQFCQQGRYLFGSLYLSATVAGASIAFLAGMMIIKAIVR